MMCSKELENGGGGRGRETETEEEVEGASLELGNIIQHLYWSSNVSML